MHVIEMLVMISSACATLSGPMTYSWSWTAAWAALRRDMPGEAALLATCGRGGTCRGACKSDWAVSTAVTPLQPPLLRGTYHDHT